MGHAPIHELRVASQWLPGMEPHEFSGVSAEPVAELIPGIRHLHHIPSPQRARDRLEVVHSTSSNDGWPAFDMIELTATKEESARLDRNFRAIQTLKELGSSMRIPTQDQRHDLLRYCGWGGFGRLFEPHYAGSHSASQERLKKLVAVEEYEALRSSVTTSIFISPTIASGMWQLASAFGFNGGTVLEPAANTGLLLAAAPQSIAKHCAFTAVEQDSMTKSILTMAFQGLPVYIRHGSIDDMPLTEKRFDLVIGQLLRRNVGPSVNDGKRPKAKGWRFSELVAAVRSAHAGGLIIMCVPVEFLDSPHVRARKWVAERAELLGAIRLPSNAFKRQSNVAFAADLLVMRKREKLADSNEDAWIDLGQAADSLMNPAALKWCYSKAQRKLVELARPINKWYELHPDLVIGELDAVDTSMGKRLISEFHGGAEEFRLRLAECIQAIVEANT